MQLVFSATCLSVLLWLLSRSRPASLLSPVYALIGVYLSVFVAGSFFYDPDYAGSADGAWIKVASSEAELYTVAMQVIWLLCAFAVGVLISGHKRRPRIKRRFGFGPSVRKLSRFQTRALLIFGVISLLLVVAGNGPSSIYRRSDYMVEANHVIKILGSASLPIAALAFGAASKSSSQLTRFLAVSSFIGSLALTVALCTRLFAVLPILFFFGGLIISSEDKRFKLGLATAILCAPFLIVVPLKGRAMPEHGLSTFPELGVELSRLDLGVTLHECANNIFVANPITADSIRSDVGDSLGYVLVEINPLPGFMTEWNDVERRVSRFIPFNAVGDLLRVGAWAGICYFGPLGFYFGRIDRAIRSRGKLSISVFALTALSFLFIILSLQYPLRTSTRLIYYMVALEVIIGVGNRILATFRGRRQGNIRYRADDRTFYSFPFSLGLGFSDQTSKAGIQGR